MSRARPVLTEDSLTAHLRRRVEAQPLLGSRREDLVQLIVAGAAAERAGRFRWSLPRRWLAPALAGGLLMLVLLALAAQLPRPVDLPPGGQAQHVLTPAELAELRQARATGMVVADISAAHVGRSMAECNGRSPCLLIVLDGVAPIVDFDIIGVEEIDTSRPAALALLDGEIEYIGPVEIKPGGFAWPVTDLAAMDEPADELHVVEGWLVQSGPHSCPAPPNIGVATPTPETGAPVRALLDYWCPASWLTAEHETLATVDDSGNMTGRVRPRGDQVQVQTGAYGEFADPQMIVYGRDAAPLPSHGHYLVRPAGCPAAAWSGQCPVWQMVGRLGVPADDGTPTTPLPEPQTPAPSAGTALHVVATVEEWCGSIGGCRYYAELDGPEDEWRAQIDVGNLGQKSTIGGQEEWPAHLPPGDYTIRMISYHMSDAIVVGQPRPLGPVAARCQAQFTVTDEPSVVAGGVFQREICFIGFGEDVPIPPSPSPMFPQGELPPIIGGEPVHVGEAASAAIEAAVDDTPFLVGGPLVYVIADCMLEPELPESPLLQPCSQGNLALDLGARVVRLVWDELLAPAGDAPIVLRVHVHDARAADCPRLYLGRCQNAVVVEEVVWRATASGNASQAEIFGAVAQWLPTAEEALPDKPLYVDETVSQGVGDFGLEHYAELGAASPPLFGATLTAESRVALTGALSDHHEPLFVPDRQSVVDPDAYDHFGCRPYLDSRAMLRLGAPRQVSEDVFLVEVNLDLGCAGRRYLLEVSLTVHGYRVTDVLARGDWIV